MGAEEPNRGTDMNAKHCKTVRGMTLIEAMITMVTLAVALIGGAHLRYYSALDARKADVQNSDARLGSLLLESWKGAGGHSDYLPEADFGSQLTISEVDSGPAVIHGFTKVGNYHIECDRGNYFATLSYKEATSTEARALNVHITWLYDRQSPEVLNMGTNQSVRLTAYVRN